MKRRAAVKQVGALLAALAAGAAVATAASASGEFQPVPRAEPAFIPGIGPGQRYPDPRPFAVYGAPETPGPILPPSITLVVPAPAPPPTPGAAFGGYVNPAGRFEWRPAPFDPARPRADQDPGPMREVTASGTAMIGEGGLAAARQVAIQQALRSALEQVAGVYVTGSTVAERYIAVRDRVYTRSTGFVIPKEVLDEKSDGSTVTVQVRALVSVRPLVGALKELGLTRSWRVGVWIQDAPGGTAAGAAGLAENHIGEALMRAGFQVVRLDGLGDGDADSLARSLRESPTPPVDVLVVGTASSRLAARVPVTLGGRVTRMAPIYRGRVEARAIRVETGEVVAQHAIDELLSNKADDVAASLAAEAAAQDAAALILDDVVMLPASHADRVRLEARGFTSRAQAQILLDALPLLPGVHKLFRQEYNDGVLSVDLEIDAVGAERLGAELENARVVQYLGLKIESDTKTRIRARVGGS